MPILVFAFAMTAIMLVGVVHSIFVEARDRRDDNSGSAGRESRSLSRLS
ncbi:MAG: hypothetical protein IPL47_14110 [Phyllobacteriaceae bacterium]|nr:hypothetical protein [Phyllobacteriaceae bacterium]